MNWHALNSDCAFSYFELSKLSLKNVLALQDFKNEGASMYRSIKIFQIDLAWNIDQTKVNRFQSLHFSIPLSAIEKIQYFLYGCPFCSLKNAWFPMLDWVQSRGVSWFSIFTGFVQVITWLCILLIHINKVIRCGCLYN